LSVAWLQLRGAGTMSMSGAPVDPLVGQLSGLEDCAGFGDISLLAYLRMVQQLAEANAVLQAFAPLI
jgi:hypothetical protein